MLSKQLIKAKPSSCGSGGSAGHLQNASTNWKAAALVCILKYPQCPLAVHTYFTLQGLQN